MPLPSPFPFPFGDRDAHDELRSHCTWAINVAEERHRQRIVNAASFRLSENSAKFCELGSAREVSFLELTFHLAICCL